MTVDDRPAAIRLPGQQRMPVGYPGVGWGVGKIDGLLFGLQLAMASDGHPIAAQPEDADRRANAEVQWTPPRPG